MNKKLIQAEKDLLELLRKKPEGLKIEQILQELGKSHDESEIRAAIWTTAADREVDLGFLETSKEYRIKLR